MAHSSSNSSFSGAVVTFGAFALCLYFAFHAVQGNSGLFSRVQIEAEEAKLQIELKELKAELAILENKTFRLSDAYLDLDLLDERARDVLGLMHGDEVVLQ